MLLYTESPNLHTHTLKVAVIDATEDEFTFELFRDTLLRRLHRLDPLRYKLIDIPWRLHHPMWLEDCEVDLDYHLRRVRVRAPGGRRELDEVIGKVAGTPLDRDRPLWEFHFAEGMADRKFAVIGKMHHALADGVASANLLARIMDPEDPGHDEGHRQPSSAAPSTRKLLRAAGRDHARPAAALPGVIAEALAGVRRLRRRSRERGRVPDLARLLQAPPTFINHVVSPGRTFATATLSLAQVKETSKHLGITINDLVMAMAAGALRELLLRYDGCADRPIVASVPASTDRSPHRISGNELGGMVVSLPTHIVDPLQRVRLASLSTAIAKENNELFGPELYGKLITYLPPIAAPPMFTLAGATEREKQAFQYPDFQCRRTARARSTGRCPGE